MKKLTYYLIAAMLVVTLLPTTLKAGNESIPAPLPAPTSSAEANVLIYRLHEIKNMDIASMKSAERKQLRQEVKSIKNKLKVIEHGVYLSVGAIIIIILLLILIL